MNKLRTWQYKNLSILFLSILFAVFLSRFEVFHNFLLNLGGFGYFSAFVAGILFVSVFTVATGVVILLVLAQDLSLLGIGLIAGFGAVVGDFLIFRFIKDSLFEEIRPVYESLGGSRVTKTLRTVFQTKYFSWAPPVIGALIIASPLPDELGIGMMGVSKIKTYQFLILSFILNFIGIFLVISASFVIKP